MLISRSTTFTVYIKKQFANQEYVLELFTRDSDGDENYDEPLEIAVSAELFNSTNIGDVVTLTPVVTPKTEVK